MTSNRRVSSGLIADILDALEQHGHLRGDDQHAGRAIGLIGDLARIWEGTQDHPAGTHLSKIPSAAPGSAPSPSPARTSARSWPPWTRPPSTSATAPRPAPTARTSPA